MYKTIVTDAGASALNDALSGQFEYKITQMAVGDGGGSDIVPSSSDVALTNELYRSNLSLLAKNPENPAQLVAEFPVPFSELEGQTVREAGLYDENGVLFAIANVPSIEFPTSALGAGRDAMIRMIFETTNADDFTLIVDPNVIYATQAWVVENSSASAMLDGPAKVYPTQQVVYKITNYNSFYEYSVSVSGASEAAIIGDTVVLTVDVSASGSLELGVTCRGYYRAVNIDVMPSAILAPSVISPKSGEEVSQYPDFSSSDFEVYPVNSDTQVAERWQVAADPAFSNILIDVTGDASDVLSGGGLPIGADLWVRVAKIGAVLDQSEWSGGVQFSVAGSDWLQWNGANDGARQYQLGQTLTSSRRIYGLIDVNETDSLFLLTTSLNYIRRRGVEMDFVASTPVYQVEGEPDVGMKVCRGGPDFGMLFWTDVSEASIKCQRFVVDELLGGVEFVGTETVLLTGLSTGSNMRELLGGVEWLDDQRFVIVTAADLTYTGTTGMQPRIAGFYIDEAGEITAGNVMTIGAVARSVGITVLDDGLVVTAAATSNSVVLETWRMPGVILSRKSIYAHSSVATNASNGGENPLIELISVDNQTLVLASATNMNSTTGQAGHFLFFSQLNLAGDVISDHSDYVNNDVSFGLSLRSDRGLVGSCKALSVADRVVVYLAKNDVFHLICGDQLNVVKTDYVGANDILATDFDSKHRVPPLVMSPEQRLIDCPAGGLKVVNAEV